MQAVKLVGARGEDFSQPDRLEALFAAADVDGDGTVSLEELLRSFKPKDGQDAADGRGSTLKHLANGTKEDKENFDKIKELQGQVFPPCSTPYG